MHSGKTFLEDYEDYLKEEDILNKWLYPNEEETNKVDNTQLNLDNISSATPTIFTGQPVVSSATTQEYLSSTEKNPENTVTSENQQLSSQSINNSSNTNSQNTVEVPTCEWNTPSIHSIDSLLANSLFPQCNTKKQSSTTLENIAFSSSNLHPAGDNTHKKSTSNNNSNNGAKRKLESNTEIKVPIIITLNQYDKFINNSNNNNHGSDLNCTQLADISKTLANDQVSIFADIHATSGLVLNKNNNSPVPKGWERVLVDLDAKGNPSLNKSYAWPRYFPVYESSGKKIPTVDITFKHWIDNRNSSKKVRLNSESFPFQENVHQGIAREVTWSHFSRQVFRNNLSLNNTLLSKEDSLTEDNTSTMTSSSVFYQHSADDVASSSTHSATIRTETFRK